MVNLALFGVGRIGKMHAQNISENSEANLKYICDVDEKTAQEIASQYNSKVVSQEEILNDDSVVGVLISSPTDTHVDLITKCAKANKYILCQMF